MAELTFDKAPAEYDPKWLDKQLERIKRGIPPTVATHSPKKIELHSDAGYAVLYRADWDCVVRRVEIWSPTTVAPSDVLYTKLDVRNKDKNVSLLAAKGGFSTNGGLQKWEWKTICALDSRAENSGADMELLQDQTVWLTWEHYDSGVALSPVLTSSEFEQFGEQAMPEEIGSLLIELDIRVTVERS